MDLRQVTADHIKGELARHQGNVARGLLSVLRSIFRALKQERLTFLNPTAGLQLPAGVHLPRPLSSDRLAEAWTGWSVPPHASSSVWSPSTPCVPRRSPGSTWPTPTSPAGHWRCAGVRASGSSTSTT